MDISLLALEQSGWFITQMLFLYCQVGEGDCGVVAVGLVCSVAFSAGMLGIERIDLALVCEK